MNNDTELSGPSGNIRKGSIEPPQVTYFFYRGKTDEPFACGEREAWKHWQDGLRLIGRSDGRMFHAAAKESQKIYDSYILEFRKNFPGQIVPPDIIEGALQLAQERLRKGFDEELEEAKKNRIPPPDNYDVIDPYNKLPKDVKEGLKALR